MNYVSNKQLEAAHPAMMRELVQFIQLRGRFSFDEIIKKVEKRFQIVLLLATVSDLYFGRKPRQELELKQEFMKLKPCKPVVAKKPKPRKSRKVVYAFD